MHYMYVIEVLQRDMRHGRNPKWDKIIKKSRHQGHQQYVVMCTPPNTIPHPMFVYYRLHVILCISQMFRGGTFCQVNQTYVKFISKTFSLKVPMSLNSSWVVVVEGSKTFTYPTSQPPPPPNLMGKVRKYILNMQIFHKVESRDGWWLEGYCIFLFTPATLCTFMISDYE